MDLSTLWQSTLILLEQKVSKPNFVTWFSNVDIKKKEGDEITLSVPNIFVKEWLKNKFESELLDSLRQFSPEIKKINYIISSKEKNNSKLFSNSLNNSKLPLDLSQQKIEFSQNRLSGLNPKYTLKNFVVGSFNQLAAACAISVIKTWTSKDNIKDLSYNPLFIYSSVGLGKTHLLEAIGNEIVNTRKKRKVKYIPCPNFTSQIITAIRSQNIEDFLEKYQSFDVLIIDDIEFIAGKERTQETFFRIFNELIDHNKQIILSSDRPPRAIEKLEERLKSRFEGGMVADISLPETEERLAILEEKVEEKGVILPKEILEFIAVNIKNNIRELEGALIKAIVLFQREQSVEVVKKELKDIINQPKNRISPEKIIDNVCSFYNVSKKDVLSKSRKKELVLPRQVIMYLMREEINLSLPSIGVKIGNKDHTTVGYACEKIEEKLKKDGDFFRDLEVIKERLYNS
ncbi:MAG TPA: chromosomal replication initiator protein DnaA [Candidatus Pacearchaeota archaeon]|nr:chromosomal replication initiator protein DnaA [Candidatus Pacearchaeota archaeon]HOK93981.1 chromosomal replication initiator protein DnaA [Candidatus Pacearchaeota archaeon]HPO75052.1 chromosomal replication initiator protein DnaA [Candidatus Pacearchaeota archaeon]